MKIEIVIALILGTALGLGGMFAVAQLTNRPNTQTLKPLPTQSTEPTTSTANVKNELVSPQGPTISWDLSLLPIKGTVRNGSFIFLVSDTTDTVFPVSNNTFDTTTPPALGIAKYRVFTEFGDKVGEAQVLSFKDLPLSKKNLFGSVTDLTADSLQMRGNDGTIDQIAYSPNVLVGSFVKDAKKISSGDVAIGDKVAVVSDRIEKSAILALGVFVVPSDFSQQEYILKTGNLTSITKNDLVISTKEGDISVKLDSNTKFFGLKTGGYVRKRTKLITSDITQVVTVTFLKDTTNIRSIFISE